MNEQLAPVILAMAALITAIGGLVQTIKTKKKVSKLDKQINNK